MGIVGGYKVQRGKSGSKLNKPPVLKLLERVYEGPPRWRSLPPKFKFHARGTTKESTPRKAIYDYLREPVVVRKMRRAWNTTNGTWLKRHPYEVSYPHFSHVLTTCTNTWCRQRTQLLGASAWVKRQRGSRNCDTCGEKLRRQLLRPITKKWIYVIEGEQKSAKLLYEIYADKPRWRYVNKPDITKSRKVRKADGRKSKMRPSHFLPRPTQKTVYQFFLSPVQLSSKALEKLMDHGDRGWVRLKGDRSHEQLDDVTVRRQFNAPPPRLQRS